MTPIEIKQLARNLADEIRLDNIGFYIDPEKHYNDHKRVCRWFSFADIFVSEGAKLTAKIVLISIAGGFAYWGYINN